MAIWSSHSRVKANMSLVMVSPWTLAIRPDDDSPNPEPILAAPATRPAYTAAILDSSMSWL